MGQKVHPVGFRLKIVNDWDSVWYEDKLYSRNAYQDLLIREYLHSVLGHAAVGKIAIFRKAGYVMIDIHSGKPGVILGKRSGSKLIDVLKKKVVSIVGLDDVDLNVVEVKKPEMNPVLMAESIAKQLERRSSYRRVMKKAAFSCMRVGAKGVKISCAGRLGGAEIARTEWIKEGRVPLHTLKANIGFGFAKAMTTYGVIGVSVWVYLGDVQIMRGIN